MKSILLFAIASAAAAAGAAFAAPSTQGTTARADDPRSQIVCRRYVRTGSLVDGYRVCKTRADWDRELQNVRQFSSSDSCRLRSADPGSGPSTPDC